MTQESNSIIRRKKPDAVLLLIVILIGIVGLFSVLKFSGDANNTVLTRPKNNQELPKTPTENPQNSFPKEVSSVNTSHQEESNTSFKISGEREAGQKVTFSLQNPDPFVQYELQLGKSKIPFKDKLVSHSFSKGGVYPIQLVATYQGKSKVIQTQSITIANSIEVVSKVKEP